MKLLIILLLLAACAEPITFEAPFYSQYNTGANNNTAVQYEWKFQVFSNGRWANASQVTICKDALVGDPCNLITIDRKIRNVKVDIFVVNVLNGNRLLPLDTKYFFDNGELRLDTDTYPVVRRKIE